MESSTVNYLDIGVNHDFVDITPDLVPLIEKSANVTLLAGHRTHTDPGFGALVFDDTWSFAGTDG
jgi:hypothetical protein